MQLMHYRWALLSALVLAAGIVLALLTWLALGQAESGTKDAIDKLEKLNAKGADNVAVAVVNGHVITRREVDVATALASLQGIGNSAG